MTTILKGAEPFQFEGDGSPVLVIHGFTGTTQSMRFLGEELNRSFGFSTYGPRLAGHGTSPDDMETTSFLDWMNSAEEALRQIATPDKPAFVTGLSMGGMLTLALAALHPELVAGIIPINAVAGKQDGGLSMAVLDAATPARIPGIGSDIKAPGVTELAYPEVPISCLRDVYLAQAAIGDILFKVTCPILVMQSRDDHVVHPSNAMHIVNSVSSNDTRLLWLENSFHVATLDNDKELIAHRAGRFIQELQDATG